MTVPEQRLIEIITTLERIEGDVSLAATRLTAIELSVKMQDADRRHTADQLRHLTMLLERVAGHP